MAVCSVEKENEKEKVCSDPKHLSSSVEDLVNDERGIVIKPDCTNEFRNKVAKAIEANNLCYNCETGFHYIKR